MRKRQINTDNDGDKRGSRHFYESKKIKTKHKTPANIQCKGETDVTLFLFTTFHFTYGKHVVKVVGWIFLPPSSTFFPPFFPPPPSSSLHIFLFPLLVPYTPFLPPHLTSLASFPLFLPSFPLSTSYQHLFVILFSLLSFLLFSLSLLYHSLPSLPLTPSLFSVSIHPKFSILSPFPAPSSLPPFPPSLPPSLRTFSLTILVRSATWSHGILEGGREGERREREHGREGGREKRGEGEKEAEGGRGIHGKGEVGNVKRVRKGSEFT